MSFGVYMEALLQFVLTFNIEWEMEMWLQVLLIFNARWKRGA
jgi:hypothetical protein